MYDSLMRPGPVFVTAGILLAVAIASFFYFIKINRSNKVQFDKELAEYNKALDELKRREDAKLKERKPVEPEPVIIVPQDKIASCPRRILFMSPNGATFDVPIDGSITLGRNPNCDLYVKNGTVLGIHCKILYDNGKYMLRNLAGENCTVFDGRGIPSNTEIEIKTGVLQLGKVTFFITIDE